MNYGRVAVVLHWTIAAAILSNLALGWWMHRAIEDPAAQGRAIAAFQLHKSIGLSILLLSVLRLVWRLSHRRPPLPAGMRAWERRAAALTHAGFYLLMLGIPFSGWLYASVQWRDGAPLTIPTLWFGLFEVPHLFGLPEAERDFRAAFAAQLVLLHRWLAWSSLGLLLLHVAAALKHQFLDRDAVLERMLPRPGWALQAVLPVLLVIGIAAWGLTVGPGTASRPAADALISGVAGSWVPDPQASHIEFSGTHAGTAFQGHFQRWQSDIRIDPAAVPAARIRASIWTGSATDGIKLHDETLPEAEWFDVAQYPTAQFEADKPVRRPDGRFGLSGQLIIKGRSIPVEGLTLSFQEDSLRIQGQFRIDRAAADLGMESDPQGEWVSREIVVDVEVLAHPP